MEVLIILETYSKELGPLQVVCNQLYLENHTPHLPPSCPIFSHRYFTNISIGGRDYSFNSDGYLSKPLLDVISYTNGRGWEEVST